MGYLQSLAVVRELRVLEARPDRLQVHLELAVGPEGFARFVDAGGTLELDPQATGDTPRYQLKP